MNQIEQLYMQGQDAFQRGDMNRAAMCFSAAYTRDPKFAPAYNGMGLVLMNMGDAARALEHYDKAIRLDPKFASPYINRSLIMSKLGKHEEALKNLGRAISLQPDNANAHANRGGILTELHQHIPAVAAYDRTLALKPDFPDARGLRLLNKAQICDWKNWDNEVTDLAARIDRGQQASPPWALVGLLDRPDCQRKMAESFIASDARENPILGPLAKRPRPARIKLAYYSWDFYNHATAYLIAGLFERHDRSKFEVIAFSFGPQTGDEMQQRLKAGVDRFIEVNDKSDPEIARLSREMAIDIAVDLKGHTVGQRLGIFAHRAAPIQAHYLGYPGTIGAPYIDYLIADETVIPPSHDAYYREKVLRLPNCYQVNDRSRTVSDRTPTRAELGLPENGFVFCSFNNSYKIHPQVFGIWMRLLTQVPGSVLWLLDDNALATANLRKEAAARGVDPARLVFAPRVPVADHLARQKLADLFLDTRPYNAHTTASDALWVGLPVLTQPGETFAGRVAASILIAMGLPELIVANAAEYEATALALATDPERLRALKERLATCRETAPLFDIEAFAGNIEAAYLEMVDAYYGASI